MRPFALENARDTADALRLASVGAAAQYLAGGTNLLDLMKLDVMRPERVVNISALRREHSVIEAGASGLRLGALVRMSEAADHPVIRRDYPVLAQSLSKAASPQLRNMATLAGNVLQRTRCNYFRNRSWAACNKRDPGSGCAAMEGCNRRLAMLGVSDHCIANYPGDFANALAALRAEVELRCRGRDAHLAVRGIAPTSGRYAASRDEFAGGRVDYRISGSGRAVDKAFVIFKNSGP